MPKNWPPPVAIFMAIKDDAKAFLSHAPYDYVAETIKCSRCGKKVPTTDTLDLICFDDEAIVCKECLEPDDKKYADNVEWHRLKASIKEKKL